MERRSSIDTKRRGSLSARCPTRRALNERTPNRPLVRMCTTSMAMHPASDEASTVTGEGPASPFPSSTHSCRLPRAVNLSWPSQVSFRSVGGRVSAMVAIAPAQRANA
jgi:hypothetical protein